MFDPIDNPTEMLYNTHRPRQKDADIIPKTNARAKGDSEDEEARDDNDLPQAPHGGAVGGSRAARRQPD